MIHIERNILTEQDRDRIMHLYRTSTNTLTDEHGTRDRFAPTTVGNFLIASFSKEEFDFVLDKVLPVVARHQHHEVTSVFQRVLCYKRNSFIPKHLDSAIAGATSNMSVIVPLNDDYTGGEMIVGNTMPELAPGDLLYYGYAVPHEIKKIKSGIRYVLNLRLNAGD